MRHVSDYRSRTDDKGGILMSCDHIDYDDYFEECLDCGLPGEAIHANECTVHGFTIDEEGNCNQCGLLLEESENAPR